MLIARFENRTGQPLLDGTLEYALANELSRSRYVNVVPRERVADALRLMRKPVDSAVDPATGREICLRDGEIRALVTGRVEKFGSKYVVSVELAEPSQGAAIAGAAEEATNEEQLCRRQRGSLTRFARGSARSPVRFVRSRGSSKSPRAHSKPCSCIHGPTP